MTIKYITIRQPYLIMMLALGVLTSCGHGPRGDESNASTETETTLLVSKVSEPEILHVDTSKRIVTFRTNGRRVNSEFLVAVDRNGEQSGILKLIDVPVSSPLRTADILEGSPSINDQIVKADGALAARLRETYREAEEPTE